MSQDIKILVVDDTTDTRMLLKALLEDDYVITEADSGKACLEQIEKQIPDLLLLDVNMPGMDGYEVCTHLRKQVSTEHLPIIFVSALDSTEERLAGFEVGADDYVIKPIDHENLTSKITSCLQRQQDLKKVQGEAADAMRIAMEAMTVSSELGQIVQFIKDMATYITGADVGQSILRITQEFGLSAIARVTTDKVVFVGCDDDSMEAKVISRFSNHSERILSVGIHTIIRNDKIELLIKDMPLDDENRYGRLKDHLAVLMDIANGHIVTIEAKTAIVKQRKIFFSEIITIAEKQIKLTSKRIVEHDENSQKIMEAMITELEAMLFGLGLEDDQEKRLMELADQTSDKLLEAKKETKDLSSDLGLILESLYNFLDTHDD